MIPNPEPSFPVELLPDEVVAGYENAMNVAGGIAVTAAIILSALLVHAYYADTYYARAGALRSYTLGLGLAVIVSLFVSLAINQWAYFIFALLVPFVLFGGRWAVFSYLNRRGY